MFSSSSAAAAAAADHRGGSVLPPGPGDLQTQSTTRLATWGYEALEKMMEHDHVELSTHDDASSADHHVGPILPMVDFALGVGVLGEAPHRACARLRARLLRSNSPHAACSTDAEHREADSSSSSRVAAATRRHQREPAATIDSDTAASSPDSHQIASSSSCVAAADGHGEALASASTSTCHRDRDRDLDPASASLHCYFHMDLGWRLGGPHCGSDRHSEDHQPRSQRLRRRRSSATRLHLHRSHHPQPRRRDLPRLLQSTAPASTFGDCASAAATSTMFNA
uniref:Uncharacterized protein n=1 Tax=Oryza meridionalis TaxID=40149 RepID=A0A0E0DU84_9ORYZ